MDRHGPLTTPTPQVLPFLLSLFLLFQRPILRSTIGSEGCRSFGFRSAGGKDRALPDTQLARFARSTAGRRGHGLQLDTARGTDRRRPGS